MSNFESGDFRSDYCTRLLNESDIVVTNPPFSLFREFFAWLMKADKKFIIVGNQNAITYKEVFPYIRDDKCRLGSQTGCKKMEFIDAQSNDELKSFGNICWFINVDLQKHHEPLILVEKYTPEKYPKYDNYDAIEVSKVKDIPCDYEGVMGVPITYMYSHNPDQFDIVGLLQSSSDEQAGIPNLRYYDDFKEMNQDDTPTGSSGKKTNGNPVLKGRPDKGKYYYNPTTNEYIYSAYARILIRRKVVN